MIRDRETQIKLIETKLEEQKKKMERVQMDRVKVTELQQAQKVEQQRDIEVVLKQYKTIQRDYRESKDSLDMKKQQQQQSMGGQHAAASTSAPTGPGLHVYNEIMKSVAAPENNDSSYVLRMQAQLCKAMHSMCMMEKQLQLSTAQQDQTTKAMKDVITRMVEEKSQVELKLMNELVLADTAKREVEIKVKEQSESFIKEKDDLMEKIERQNDPEEEDEESDDEEEKEELQEILVQGREEIERLEQENKKQDEELEVLKEKVAKTNGQDIVDEIVTSIAEEFKEREEEDGSDEDDD
ncbi:MAG: hypothetical protein SGARI_006071 [Bacillariaceae sp.]